MTDHPPDKAAAEKRVVAYADFPDEQRFSFRVAPLPGRLLSAETVGGCLTYIAKAIKSANREYVKGSRFIALCGVRFDEDGAFVADLAELPVQKPPLNDQNSRSRDE